MFSFLDRFFGKSAGQQEQNSPITNAYFLLRPSDQEVVRNYFGAACDICRLLDRLRRQEQDVAHEAVLARFERAEKLYSAVGFLPILPSSVRHQPGNSSPQFDAERLPERGFLVRRESGRLPFFYASAVKKHVARLRAAKPRAFVSSPRVAVLPCQTPKHQSIGYQAWSPRSLRAVANNSRKEQNARSALACQRFAVLRGHFTG